MLLTLILCIAEEINTVKRAQTPTPEQLEMRKRWQQNDQQFKTIQDKIKAI